MQSKHRTRFEPIDAMDARKQLGSFLNKVELMQQRFVIHRRGQAKALLVPLDDQNAIENSLTDEKTELDALYSAFDMLCGVIDDPNGYDASTTIDEVLYGQEQQILLEGNGK